MFRLLRAFFVNASLIVISVVVALALAEIALRFTKFADTPAKYRLPRNHFVADATLGYDIGKHAPNGIHRLAENPYPVFGNRFGCFDYDREVPASYGLIVGDSVTWGYAPLEHKWTTRLEQLTGMFMLKCGVTGYGTRQEFIKAKRVVEQVGHPPRYIIVLYVGNDLNDDFAFPQRTVYEGYLVGRINEVDLQTGEITYRSQAQIERKYQKLIAGTFANWKRRMLQESVLYKNYKWFVAPQIRKIRSNIKLWRQEHSSEPDSTTANDTPANGETFPVEEMPAAMRRVYDVHLINYSDKMDLPWLNELFDQHQLTIRDFAEYASGLGAHFLLIDIDGLLEHPRFDSLQKFFAASETAHYYNLRTDYPNQSRWKFDSHWDIEGNQEAAKHIYTYFGARGVFPQQRVEERQ